MTVGVPMTSNAGIKRSHNTDRRTLGRFLEFCIEKSTTVEACWFVRKVHHCRSSSPPLKPTVEFVVAIDLPESSPALAPESNADDVTPSPYALSPPFSPTAHSPSPYFRSPSTSPLALESSPLPLLDSFPVPTPSPTPSLFNARNVRHTSTENIAGDKRESSSGLKGGRKAELALGVITNVAMLGLVCLVYKKWKGNIQ
ncbi:proline-rich receptor-like protein kinase PERK1 [Vitis riparia]|uniref:proline-rich receptor-like protein kinase PERK1 n=1 Tax=Vitis riparia TaxID=96939 RepID=UPI00155A87A7|nr:proline-rich receptor-like protein kinase PERK1 [Vitis riparia]